jgi:hypothetical protein
LLGVGRFSTGTVRLESQKSRKAVISDATYRRSEGTM